MQDLDNCLLLDNTRASSNCPCLNGNFAAIDFETANNERSSVCSVGVVIVRGGEIVDKADIPMLQLVVRFHLLQVGSINSHL